LLIGREDLEDGKIENNKIGDDENDVGIADCERKNFNYIGCCAVSLYSTNLVIDKVTVKIANTF
jgi:hypothetical protein